MKRTLRHCLLISLSLFCLSVYGQERRPARTIIKWAPLALMDQDATLEFGLEHRLRSRQSVQVMAGYGWKGLSLPESDLERKKGAEVWRARAEYRWYTGRFRTNKRKEIEVRTDFPLGNYWALEGLFKQINMQEEWVSSRPTSAERLSATNRQFTYALHGKAGRQIALTARERQRNALLLDVYVGIGFRANYMDNRAARLDPQYNQTPTMFQRFTYEGWNILPSLTAGVRLGFSL